jgi:hypothetical protein
MSRLACSAPKAISPWPSAVDHAQRRDLLGVAARLRQPACV